MKMQVVAWGIAAALLSAACDGETVALTPPGGWQLPTGDAGSESPKDAGHTLDLDGAVTHEDAGAGSQDDAANGTDSGSGDDDGSIKPPPPEDSGTPDTGVDAGQDTGTTGQVDTGAPSVQDICVSEINNYRATNGKPPLSRWSAEESCADSQSQSDSASGTAHGAFGHCNEFGQCECPGWPGPMDKMIKDCLKAMWNEGPGGGHHDIMNSDSYTKVACGFYTLPNGNIWAVQDYK